MYETLEHWKQYKLEKLELELQEMLKENSIKNQLADNSTTLVSEYAKESFDKWMESLIAKNGTTNY